MGLLGRSLLNAQRDFFHGNLVVSHSSVAAIIQQIVLFFAEGFKLFFSEHGVKAFVEFVAVVIALSVDEGDFASSDILLQFAILILKAEGKDGARTLRVIVFAFDGAVFANDLNSTKSQS